MYPLKQLTYDLTDFDETYCKAVVQS